MYGELADAQAASGRVDFNLATTRYGAVRDPIKSLVECGSGEDIETIVCDGRTLLDHRVPQTVDEPALLRAIQESGEAVWAGVPQWHWRGASVDEMVPLSYPVRGRVSPLRASGTSRLPLGGRGAKMDARCRADGLHRREAAGARGGGEPLKLHPHIGAGTCRARFADGGPGLRARRVPVVQCVQGSSFCLSITVLNCRTQAVRCDSV